MKSKKIKKWKIKTALMPIGADGKEYDWFYGWDGIIGYAKALNKSWVDVGELMELTWGDRTTFRQVHCCSEVHRSLINVQKGMYRGKKRLSLAPTGKEPDIHFAIRMNRKTIFDLYKKTGGTAKDKYKAITQLYNKMISGPRKSFLISAAREEKNIK